MYLATTITQCVETHDHLPRPICIVMVVCMRGCYSGGSCGVAAVCDIYQSWRPLMTAAYISALLWRHYGLDGVSNHQPYGCLLNSGADQRKHQSSASLALVWGIHRWPVNSPHKWPGIWKILPFDDVIVDLHPSNLELAETIQFFSIQTVLLYCG